MPSLAAVHPLRFCPRCCSVFTAHVNFCGLDGTALQVSNEDSLVGCEVDRYLVLDRIGMGATGCVYRVQHSILEQEHAMKILFGDLSQDARIVERFKREAKAIGKMRHRNILSVTDFGRTANGLTFLVMEFVRGVTLEAEINVGAPFSIHRAARIVEQIAAGLGEAHRLGFIHRDIKPTNIMLTGSGDEEQVKILDFGIVGLRAEAFDARLTAAGFIIGTPAYMAPEQAYDPSRVTPAADFYSLGVILFEMLTGRLPFEATQPVEMILQHSTQPVPELPPARGLEEITAWMLEKRPSDRPQTAEQVLEALALLRLELPPDDQDQEEMITQEIGAARQPVYFEGLCDRLESLRETINGEIAMSPSVKQTFDARVAQLVAAARPGLHAYRYLDLAQQISELERELSDRN